MCLGSSVTLRSLIQTHPGQRFKVLGICRSASDAMRAKMMNLGFLVGEEIEVLWQAPMQRGALAVRVRDVTFGLRAADLALILVEEIQS